MLSTLQRKALAEFLRLVILKNGMQCLSDSKSCIYLRSSRSLYRMILSNSRLCNFVIEFSDWRIWQAGSQCLGLLRGSIKTVLSSLGSLQVLSDEFELFSYRKSRQRSKTHQRKTPECPSGYTACFFPAICRFPGQ